MYIDPQSVTIPFALLAGLLSFVSPCVLPLVPAYIGYLTGQAANTASSTLAAAGAGVEGGASIQAQPARWVVFLHAISFVLGFSLIFVFLGISAGAIGQASRGFLILTDTTLARITVAGQPISISLLNALGGLLVIVLGLHTMGVIRIPFLYYDTRSHTPPHQELGYLGSLFMGVTFSAGWTPCVGPFLAAMWFLGQSTGSIGRATVLLIAYSLGLGVPFLLTALLLDRATGLLSRLRKYMRVIEIASGILLILIGLLVFSGMVQRLSIMFAGGSDLSRMLDEWLVRLAGGQP